MVVGDRIYNYLKKRSWEDNLIASMKKRKPSKRINQEVPGGSGVCTIQKEAQGAVIGT